MISSGSVILLHSLASFGGVLFDGTSMWVTSECWFGLITYLILAKDRLRSSIWRILLMICLISLSSDNVSRCSSRFLMEVCRMVRTSFLVSRSMDFRSCSDVGRGYVSCSLDWSVWIWLVFCILNCIQDSCSFRRETLIHA